MTREEAVSIIEERVHVTEYVKSSYVDCVDIDALKMAIEALRQPENIRCKDCVYVSPNTKNGCELRRWRWFDGSEFMGGEDYCSRAERREE